MSTITQNRLAKIKSPYKCTKNGQNYLVRKTASKVKLGPREQG
ncbi:hypothetical protein EC5412_3198 [Escherichia coli 5412]|nr:hypothetical protein EC5412_3198 [Escherichia coli 5412]EMZ80894.1 hypothetical protein EC2722950_2388 [Escherichia coli 2722950]ENB21952.1 hypothetical protein ECBCE011MS01_2244 [Escherichia coli BCE011_MS-01]